MKSLAPAAIFLLCLAIPAVLWLAGFAAVCWVAATVFKAVMS